MIENQQTLELRPRPLDLARVHAERFASLRTHLLALAPGLELATVDGTRRWTRLLAHDDVDAWLIAWAPGARIDAHDQGGSDAVFQVLAGRLTESYLNADRTRRVRVVGRGRSVTVPQGRVHEVANVGAVRAVSVHVYSPPLTDMRFRD